MARRTAACLAVADHTPDGSGNARLTDPGARRAGPQSVDLLQRAIGDAVARKGAYPELAAH
jgi:hypothetical protein